jgi:hypothetical protein
MTSNLVEKEEVLRKFFETISNESDLDSLRSVLGSEWRDTLGRNDEFVSLLLEHLKLLISEPDETIRTLATLFEFGYIFAKVEQGAMSTTIIN